MAPPIRHETEHEGAWRRAWVCSFIIGSINYILGPIAGSCRPGIAFADFQGESCG
jgi:hypothetical protein